MVIKLDFTKKERAYIAGRGGRGKKRTLGKEVRRIIKNLSEKKHTDEYSTGSAVDTTGGLICLTDSIAQGDGDTQRIGDIVKLVSIKGRFLLAANGSATGHNVCRIVMYRWKMDDAVESPALNDVFYDTVNTPFLSNIVRDMKKLTVLMDKTVVLSPTGVNGAYKMFYVNIPASKLSNIHYADQASTGTGQIYMTVLGSAGAGTSAATLYYHARLEYLDL